MSKIELTCHNCESKFLKPRNEWKRQTKKGRKYFFCCLSCSNLWQHQHGTYDYAACSKNLLKGYDKSDEYTPYRWFILRCCRRDRIKKRGISGTSITVEYLKRLFMEQGGMCPFTGWKMRLPDNADGWKDDQDPRRASLDRIDNSKGYVEGNVRFTSVIANYARHSFTDEQLIEFCESVSAWKRKAA